MSKQTEHTHQLHNQSALDKFDLAFEYNVSWGDIKKSLKDRAA